MPLPGSVGRRHLLAALAKAVTQRSVLLLTGAGGVGKTSLAVQHAAEIAERYPDGQLYVDLHGHDATREPTRPLDALEDMLVGLNVATHALPGSVSARSGLLRSILTSRRVLILLDDAHDFDQVRTLLPGPGRTDVIITSRRPMPALVASEHAEPIQLQSFADNELREFVARRLPPGDAVVAADVLVHSAR